MDNEAREQSAYNHTNFRSFQSHDIQRAETVPRNAHGVSLRPVSELPDVYRGMFKFGVFNAVQSTCFDYILKRNVNMVTQRVVLNSLPSFDTTHRLVSIAPTGSGKTVLFELAIIRALEQSKVSSKPVKCVYVAPTKALCTEKFQDWSTKFDPIGFKCAELTGDTVVFGSSAWGSARSASIMSCEKWDSLTRNWREHETILSQIGLFLVDEVHILNESRGSTLEVVVSRMKFRAPALRFVLVSATVPNINDVARWIGGEASKGKQAHVFQFGDEYRPCKLTRHVVPVHRRHDQNDFQFAKTLDYKLFQVIQEYSTGRPILIFCPTRKGVFDAAEQLLKDYDVLEAKKESLPWMRPRGLSQSFSDKRLNELARAGLGVHHAGLPIEDRKMTESLFSKKHIRVLVATSTLAVGVNLPAHMVIIKGVHLFQNNESKEYSDLDIMQMLGRAGRPQFDKDGVAVILCESSLEAKYTALVEGRTILESSLNTNLAEHINSEISLGTITDIKSAKCWIYGSFLYQRMQQNPRYYALGDEKDRTCQERVDEMVMNSVSQLKEISLIQYDEQGGEGAALRSTPYGEIMSKMQLILALPPHSSLREIVFNKLKRDMDIRFEVSKVEKTCDKVFLLVQAVLGGVSWQNPEYKNGESQPYMESLSIFKHIPRIAKATVDVAIIKGDGVQIKNALELVRCLSAKAWEDRAVVMKQIEQIGEKSWYCSDFFFFCPAFVKLGCQVLAEHGIVSLTALQKQSPLRIETLLNRRSPFGLDVLASLAELPQYDLDIRELSVTSNQGKGPVEVELSIHCSLVHGSDTNPRLTKKSTRARSFHVAVILTITSDMELIDLRRIPSKALKDSRAFELSVILTKPSQSIIVMISSDMDLVGLEDDPDFWNMSIDTSEAEGKCGSPNDGKTARQRHGNKQLSKKGPTSKQCRMVDTGASHIISIRYLSCNHTCKDKTTCRHLCCREGLEDPPKTKKNSQIDATEKETAKSSILQLLDAKHSKDKAVIRKNEWKMNELNQIHAQAKVEENLQLKVGQRIKLDAGPPKKQKRPAPNYDIQFTELHDGDDEGVLSASDSEDLPESVMSAFTSSGVNRATLRMPSTPHERHHTTNVPLKMPKEKEAILRQPITTSPPRKRTKVTHSSEVI
ncbi:hypothetical protein BJ165DRAFT_1339967 [Panaeolus papilionaceus]|nr:hypothetical protein BJ165DRAFT_1339967 [Panaeolus papilionaceus]